MITRLVLLALCGFFLLRPSVAQDQEAAAAEPPVDGLRSSEDASGTLLSEGDRPILFYQRQTKSMEGKWPRAGYVHPLHGLDGEVVTEDFPLDHRHHRGVFWAWHQVWVGDQAIGDPWLCRDFQWDVESVRVSPAASSIRLEAEVVWRSPKYVDPSGQRLPIVRETTRVTAHAAEEDYRLIDFEISLLALADEVRIGGSDDVKGYGGFSPRIKLSDDLRFRSLDGPVQPVKTAVSAGRWIDMSGPEYGLAMIVHGDNPVPNGSFILRQKRSMQNAVYPGRDPVSISRVNPTILRYRLVVHRGTLSPAIIEQLSERFTPTNR